MSRPLFIVMAAPSGAGKTTLCDRLLADFDDIVYSVSCTTRPPRGEEIDGEDYYFISEEDFDKKLHSGLFLEYATVHGHRYGTLKGTVMSALGDEQSVLMDIDVQGARQVREYVGGSAKEDPLREGFLDIFISPPSLDILHERLIKRGEDSPEAISRRMANAEGEMNCRDEFRCVIVNEDIEQAYRRLKDIITLAKG